MSPIPGYLDIGEIAKRFRVHYSQAAKYIKPAGPLPCIFVGRSKLVPVEAVEKFSPNPVGNPNFRKKKKGKKKTS